MRLSQPFLKLPVRFDADALASEMAALPESAWEPHPNGFPGNEAVKLVTRGGQLTDLPEGAMGATPYLEQCAYVREIMSAIGAVWGRSRFMSLAAGSQVPPHVDIHYYWRTHWRLHIPVVTNPCVEFTCGGETVHMAAGECWAFDSFRWHDVQNKGTERRVHLVIDTVGGGSLPALFAAARDGTDDAKLIAPGTATGGDIAFEQFNSPDVMSPWEMRCHLAFLVEEVRPHPLLASVIGRIERFIDNWAAAWARFGARREGIGTYLPLIKETREELGRMGGADIRLANDIRLYAALDSLIFQMAIGRSASSEIG